MQTTLSILTPKNDYLGYLRKKAQLVTKFDSKLKQTICELHSSLTQIREDLGFGRALAAPQVGISRRIIVMNLGANPITIINPEITWVSKEMQDVWDDCLSFPDTLVKISRHKSISIKFQNIKGETHLWLNLPDDMSELLQHECEHLDGILMTDHVLSDNTRPVTDRCFVAPSQKKHRLSLTRIRQAAEVIDPLFINSPLIKAKHFSKLIESNIWLKDETKNPIGCFKGRGAENFFQMTDGMNKNYAIVCASAGNWGLALAWSCHKRNHPLFVFVPENANHKKIEKIKALGAKVIEFGSDFDSAKQKAKKFSRENNYRFLEDGKEIAISEGAGSIAVELLSHGKYFDRIYVPLGNGALITGVGRWIKASSPMTKVIGVVPKGANSMYLSWKQSNVVKCNTVNTIADGLAVRIPIPEAINDMEEIVDEIILVTDEQIKTAMELAEQKESIVLEPSGAAGLAGLLVDRKTKVIEGEIAVLLTGANRA